MPWLHTCHLPGSFRIFIKRAGVGSEYICVCGKRYTLGMRVNDDIGKTYWRWELSDDETHGTKTETSKAKHSTGFQVNENDT